MSTIATLPFNAENKYSNPLKETVKFVGYKTHKMKKVRVLKADQYVVKKNIISITDDNIVLGTGDRIYIEG